MMKSSDWSQQGAYSLTPKAHVSAPVSLGLSDSFLSPCIDIFTPAVCTTQSSKFLGANFSDTTQNDHTRHSNTVSALCHTSPPTMENPSACSEHLSSIIAQVPNYIAPRDSVLLPPVPGLPTTALPSFPYNVPLTNPSLLDQSQLVSTPPSPATGLEPPVPGQPMHANYIPSKAMPPRMPPPNIVSPNVTNFTFNGYSQLMMKDHALIHDQYEVHLNETLNKDVRSEATSTAIAEGGTGSSAAPHLHSGLLTSTLKCTNSTSPSSLRPSNLQGKVAPPIFSMPGSLAPPGIVSSAPVSSAARLILTSSFLPGPSGQQHIYPPYPYPSLSYVASSPQGPWLHPPQLAGLPRPTFSPYPSVFHGHFPLPACGMPLPSIPLPDSQPPGVTPVGNFSGTRLPSLNSGHQSGHTSVVQPDLPPGTGIDNSKEGNDVRMKDGVTVDEQSNAWTAHKTDSRAVYYYNALTGESTYAKPPGFKGQVSSWQISSDRAESRKMDIRTSSVLNERFSATPDTTMLTEKGSVSTSLSAPAMNTGGREAISLRVSVGLDSTSALYLIKKKLQDSGSPVIPNPMLTSPKHATLELNATRTVDCSVNVMQDENKDKLRIVNGDGNLSEMSSDSEGANNGPTREECITHFKEMLKERGVAPFSKWEKELPKIVFDPRFKAVSCYSVRRSLFEHYVKTRAEVERKEKRAAQKAAIEGFKKLLEVAAEKIDHTTDYHSFRRKWGTDPRFEALDRKERELLLNERVLMLKKASEEKDNAIRATAASSFRSMLQDMGDLTVNTRWSTVKDFLRNDSRFKSVKREDREVLFNEHIAELKASTIESESLVKAKMQEQDKLRERERELRKRKEREEHEMERVRLKIRRKEAVSSFQALLVESIKDPQASLSESRHILEKDHQGRAMNAALDPADKEKVFREHIKMLNQRSIHDFKVLLSEVLTTDSAAVETKDGKCCLKSWSRAKSLLKADPRYAKAPREQRELLWRRYAEEMLAKLKARMDGDNDTKRRKGFVAYH